MPTHPNPYQTDLDRNPANFTALTPLSLLAWVADVYPHQLAVIHGPLRRTWEQVRERSHRLASMLVALDIGEGDTVSVILPNTPPMIEAHYGVPMTGAVLNTINTRLDPTTVAFMLEHSAAKVLITDREFSATVKQALNQLRDAGKPMPYVVDVDDPVYDGPGDRLGEAEYEAWIAQGDPDHPARMPADEWDAIGLNYTSGTTGNPKGVVVHHRGAYLNAVNNVISWHLPRHPIYLWTLPMFHCNGWCFPWTLAAVAGTNVCLRRVEAKAILDSIREYRVSHYCGAPIVHSMLLNAPDELKRGIDHEVRCMVAGASPPATMISGMQSLGFDLTHVYGLTEVYGPAAACSHQRDWDQLDLEGRARMKGRQGMRYQLQESMTVLNPDTLEPVPRDGETIGEVVFKGNITMKGYLKNPVATREAFAGGWFHTGDLGVLDPDGYVKLKDRAKDIIISGGENISSIEVEDVIYKYPGVVGCAVVAKPDAKWGETPLAFVELRPGTTVSEQDLIAHCRAHLAGFKCPREVRFETVPRTSTGKIQKHLLRAKIGSAAAI